VGREVGNLGLAPAFTMILILFTSHLGNGTFLMRISKHLIA
jgi:hypothetical protein